jgi:type I restriction enzyme R subunit
VALDLKAVVGSENRVKLIARNLVEHFADRLATMDGKTMVVDAAHGRLARPVRVTVKRTPELHRESPVLGVFSCEASSSLTISG